MGSRNPFRRSGATSIQRQAPQHVPVIRGPQEGSQTLKPQGPGSRGPEGEGPSRCPGSAPHRAAAAPRLSGRAPLFSPTRQNPAPTGTAAPGTPGESHTTRGKPPGLPQAGHRSLLRDEAAERNKERLSAPPS
ncbi:hypothetical protein NDU88_001122 [Pleurodeles waltl]|uniref:Uncharacterized protein n=1 Tax=Pleurodeles waltl TaxID=8319 RepID=A0AAV7MIU9_PLEWA|nr:hypothetical protein NDU88_001122 [Pleurodeles waltl]